MLEPERKDLWCKPQPHAKSLFVCGQGQHNIKHGKNGCSCHVLGSEIKLMMKPWDRNFHEFVRGNGSTPNHSLES